MPQEQGLYKVQVGNRNAFWGYTYKSDGRSVEYRYGRIGATGNTTEKAYRDQYVRDREVEKKITEKLKEGYKPETAEGLKKEVAVAEALGSQYKIQQLKFVSNRSDNAFSFGKQYDPELGVVIELLNSWTKESDYLYLNRTESLELCGRSGNNTSQIGDTLTCTMMRDYPDTRKARAIRDFLKSTAQAVAKIITMSFGMADRKLHLGDDEDTSETELIVDAINKQSAGSGIGQQAMFSFAALGSRMLDL